MNEIKYGLISKVDAACLEKTIDLICDEFDDKAINVLEIGCYGGDTGKGIKEYIESKNRQCFITGIDNNKDEEKLRFEYDCMLVGDSKEIYWTRADSFFHIILVDGDHSYLGVIADFFGYASKVKEGGYFCFHDTGKHIKEFTDFQHGDKYNRDAYISVRKALNKVRLLDDSGFKNGDWNVLDNWQLIFDEADTSDLAGGICVFKKLF